MSSSELHIAALWARNEDVARQLAAGADVNARSRGGYTPAHIAAHFGHASTLQLLLDAGADRFSRTEWSSTLLHFAARRPEPDCIEVIVQHGACRSGDLNVRDINGHTPLAQAVCGGQTEHVRLLLEAGCDPNVRTRFRDPDACTLVHYCSGYVGGNATSSAMVSLLLKHGGDGAVPNLGGETPLQRAIQVRNFAVADMLLDAGVDVFAPSKGGAAHTPLARLRAAASANPAADRSSAPALAMLETVRRWEPETLDARVAAEAVAAADRAERCR